MVAPGNKRITLSYDAAGRRSATNSPSGCITCTWDAAGQLATVRNPFGERTTLAYDNAGRRTLKLLANSTRASFTYDDANQLLTVANLDSTPAYIDRLDYGYDEAGNRTSMLEFSGARTTWTYDDTNQLLSEHRAGANAVAEMEQETRRERQAAGIAVAKREGKYKGRKRGSFKVSPARVRELRERGLSLEMIGRALGVSKMSVSRYLKQGDA